MVYQPLVYLPRLARFLCRLEFCDLAGTAACFYCDRYSCSCFSCKGVICSVRRVFSSSVLIFMFLCILVCPALAASSDAPSSPDFSGAVYVSVTGSHLGAVTIFIPSNYQTGYLTLLGGVPYNASATTITGYVLASDGTPSYYVRWSAFSFAQYRSYSSTNSQYSDLDISGVASSNIAWLDYAEDDQPSLYVWYLIFAALLCLVVIVCFIKL